MTEYKAQSKGLLSFDVTRNDKFIGRLSYKNWYSFKASVELADNSTYQIEEKGFWGTTIELKHNEKLLLNFKMNWNGDIIIQTYFDRAEADYVFKHKGFLKESYVLLDRKGTELLVMKPDLNWRKLNYNYQLTTTNEFDEFSNSKILLFTVLHCANYYVSAAGSAGS